MSKTTTPLTEYKTSRFPRRTKHAELTERLQELVVTLQPGDRLPAQEELMRQYQVSDRTVLRSLQDLQRAGWIERKPGSGTYVTDPRTRIAADSTVRSLSSPPRQTISVIAPHLFVTTYLRHCANLLAQQAEAIGLSLTCHVARDPQMAADLQMLEAINPQGFVMLGYPLVSIAEELIARGHRAVVMGTPPRDTDPSVPCVCSDHELGGYLVTRHLLDQGHRHLAFAFDEQMIFSPEQNPRLRGYERALQEARSRGELVTHTLIDQKRLTAWREDITLATAYFRQPDAPTGIAVWNDGGAILLLGLLHRAGLRVPRDVSVIGFDDIPDGIDSIPPLTTVNQHIEWQVQAIIRLLTRPTPPPPQAIVTLPELKERSSCGPPPANREIK